MQFKVKVYLDENRHTNIIVTQYGGPTVANTYPHDWLNLTDEMKWRRKVEKIKKRFRKGEFDDYN